MIVVHPLVDVELETVMVSDVVCVRVCVQVKSHTCVNGPTVDGASHAPTSSPAIFVNTPGIVRFAAPFVLVRSLDPITSHCIQSVTVDPSHRFYTWTMPLIRIESISWLLYIKCCSTCNTCMEICFSTIILSVQNDVLKPSTNLPFMNWVIMTQFCNKLDELPPVNYFRDANRAWSSPTDLSYSLFAVTRLWIR